jgi:hypothetical protein
MFFLLKRLVPIALGAAAALQLERLIESKRARYTPNAVTGRLLDRVNERLERSR